MHGQQNVKKNHPYMYSNVPTNELITTIDIMCDEHVIGEELKHEIMKISRIIVKQKYLQFQNTLYKQEGLAMSAPTSTIFSEIYLKHIQNTTIADILLKYHTVGYFHYADDILTVYNNDTRHYMNKTGIVGLTLILLTWRIG